MALSPNPIKSNTFLSIGGFGGLGCWPVPTSFLPASLILSHKDFFGSEGGSVTIAFSLYGDFPVDSLVGRSGVGGGAGGGDGGGDGGRISLLTLFLAMSNCFLASST